MLNFIEVLGPDGENNVLILSFLSKLLVREMLHLTLLEIKPIGNEGHVVQFISLTFALNWAFVIGGSVENSDFPYTSFLVAPFIEHS